MILHIDGWWGGGKSLLRGLLDGHPEIFSSPIHDIISLAFQNETYESEWLINKDTEYLRTLLAVKGRYYRIERFVNQKEIFLDFSSHDRIYLPFKMSFYDFDKAVFEKLKHLNQWTIEQITTVIYETFSEHLTNRKKTFYAALGEPNISFLKHFTAIFPNSKYIYVERDIKSIIATRSNRREIKEDFRSKNGYANSFRGLIDNNEVEKIFNYIKEVKILCQKYPDNYLIVAFEELVKNPADAMKAVCEFMGVEPHTNTHFFSYLGKEVICNGVSYTEVENDNFNDLLSPEEIAEINNRISRLHKNRYNTSSNRCFKPYLNKIRLHFNSILMRDRLS